MSLPAILFLSHLAAQSAPTAPSELKFDRALVDRLARAYAELGPVEPLDLGGGDPLELLEVLTSIRAHHPVLVAATANVRGARGERLAAAGGFDPKVGADGQLTPEGFYDVTALEAKVVQPTPIWGIEVLGGYRIGRATNFATYDERETLDGGEIKGGLRLPVLQDGWIDARRADIRTAELGVDEAEAMRDADALGLGVAGADAYWTWVAAGESYRVIEQLVRLAEVRGEQVDAQVEAGAAPQIDRAENLRSLLKRRDKLVEGRRKLEKAAIKLSLFLRTETGQPRLPDLEELPASVPRAEGLSPAELQQGVARALSGRPELGSLEAKLAALEVEAELADNRILPRLDLELAVSKDFGTDPDPKTFESLDPFMVKALMVFELPLFLRKGRGKAEKAWAKVAETAAKLSFVRDKVRAEIQDLWSALTASAQRSKVAGQAADVAEAVAAGERARLEAGATSPFVVNLREQAAADARLLEIAARADLQVALTAWRLATLASPIPPLVGED